MLESTKEIENCFFIFDKSHREKIKTFTLKIQGIREVDTFICLASRLFYNFTRRDFEKWIILKIIYGILRWKLAFVYLAWELKW